jgi:hypothetical protein
MSILPNASSVHIYGGSFTAVNNSNPTGQTDSAFSRFRIIKLLSTNIDRTAQEILKKHVAFEALHNSSTSFDKPRCHPETRTAVLEDLDRWARDIGEHVKPIMWLRGPAGAGKSAIAQTLAEQWGGGNQDGLVLLAAFIFSRQRPGCNDKSGFLPTIAYQLRMNLPTTLHDIDSAIIHDLALFEKSINAQVLELLVRPLQTLRQHQSNDEASNLPWVIIIDGLDECSTQLGDQDNESQQREILEAITAVITKHKIPIRFLIASRPEPQIENAFDQGALSEIATSTKLTDTAESRADIELFVRSTFNKIHSDHRHLDPAWPKEEDIAEILKKSSGYFIYASVVMRFICRTRGDPITRLETVLRLKPTSDKAYKNPYAELDSLYTYILSTITPESLPIVNRILGLFLSLKSWDTVENAKKVPTAAAIEEWLFLRPGQIFHHLASLRSVLIDVPHATDHRDKGGQVRIIHASFSDFLGDPIRSKLFHHDTNYDNTQFLLHRFTRMLVSCSRSDDSRKPDAYVDSSFLGTDLDRLPPSVALKEVIEVLLTSANRDKHFFLFLQEKAWFPQGFGECSSFKFSLASLLPQSLIH